MSFLEIEGLSCSYGKHTVLRELSFRQKRGTMMGILGVNGCGKTTLLKSICGLLPHSGRCTLDGRDLASLTVRQLAQVCSYIPQRSGISIDISALDVVLMGFNSRLRLLEYPTAAMKQAARQALEAAGLSGIEEKNYQTLSEGQKQLCVLARTMVSDASLLLLDEPESALDFGGRYRMLSRVHEWVVSKNTGALVTLHDPQLALNCCDSLLLLRDGGVLDVLHPDSDSAEEMEALLRELYGELSLLRVKNRFDKPQWVLIK